MTDDIEDQLRDSLRRARLPAAPESLRAYRLALADHPNDPRRGVRKRPLILLVPVAAVLVGVIAWAAGASTPSPPPPNPSAATASSTPTPLASPSIKSSPSPAVDVSSARTVSELLAARKAGDAPGGPYLLRGYWTDRSVGSMCAPPPEQTGELELWCQDGEWGITERDEPIVDLIIKHQANGTSTSGAVAAGPHLTPWVPNEADARRLFALPFVNGQFWPPVPIVVSGHFDDPKASECRAKARQSCLDRFVIDQIVSFEPDALASPAPSPSPTPFPISDPPPALFTNNACYHGVPKKFSGWIPFADLNIQVSGPGYVYAMVTRDVIAIGGWYDNSNYPGHKTRWWGQGVCYAVDKGSTGFLPITGTTYLEVDDGRHIEGVAP